MSSLTSEMGIEIMKSGQLIWSALIAILSTGCSVSPQRPPFQGYPFVEVEGVTPEEIQSRFGVSCLNGGRIIQTTAYSVTCARPMGSSMIELTYRALMTETNASNPDMVLQTAWARTSSGKIRVTATAWIEHQSAFGKTSRNDLDDDSTKYSIQEALEKFKRNIGAQAIQAH